MTEHEGIRTTANAMSQAERTQSATPPSGAGPSGDLGEAARAAHPLADEQLVALHEIAKALAREKSLTRALALIAEKALHLTRCTSTALALLDEDRQMLDFTAVAGRGSAEMVGQRVRVDDALPGQTALSGEPLLAYSPSQPPLPGEADAPGLSRALLEAEKQSFAQTPDEDRFVVGGVRSAAVVPIFVDGSPIGSLAAINRRDGQSFGGADLLILQILASAAAVAIQTESLRRQNVQKERERDLLFESARTTSSTLNVQQIFDGVLGTLAKSIDLFAAMVFLSNDENTHLFIAAEQGLTEEEREVQLLPDGKLASAAFNPPQGTAFLISDALTDPRAETILPEARARPRSLLVAPLVSRENPMGLIVVASLAPNLYTSEDLRLVSAVAAQAAVALENALLYEDATRRAEEATAIYELSQSVNTNLNLHRVLNFVADSVLALLHVDKFALFLHNPDLDALEIKVARNIRRETVQGMRCTREAGGIAWWVYEFETPTAVQSLKADHRNRSLPLEHEGVASLVSVPLQAGDQVIGVIHAMSSRRRLFTVAEMELLYTISNQVGVAISNIQILEDTRQKSGELRRASRRVSRALGTSLDTPQTAQMIVDLASEIMRADRCVLYAVETVNGKLIARAAHGVRLPAGDQGASLRAGGETSAAWVARKGRSLILTNPAGDARFSPPQGLNAQLSRTGAYLGVPLKIGTSVVGVLEMYSREARTFPTDEIRQFLAFGAQAAVALQNALLIEQSGRRRRDLQMLATLASRLASGGSDDHVALFTETVRLLTAATDADAGAICISPSPDTEPRVWLDAPNHEEEDIAQSLLPAAARTVREIGAFRVPTAGVAGPAGWRERLEGRALVAVPLHVFGGEGAICLLRRSQRAPFDDNDLHLARTVADLLMTAGRR